jgi:hypothetical protein
MMIFGETSIAENAPHPKKYGTRNGEGHEGHFLLAPDSSHCRGHGRRGRMSRGCGSSSPTVTVTVAPGAASAAQPGTSALATVATSAPPSAAPSNSLAANFSDGTQVLVATGTQDGGSGNGWTEVLEVIAGPNGFPNVGSLQVQDMSNDPGGTWESSGSPLFYYGYSSPGSSNTSEPQLPANPTNQDVAPPSELAPGASICVQQDFESANASSDNQGPDGYSVTATLANGASDTVTLPTDGSGPGDACLFNG